MHVVVKRGKQAPEISAGRDDGAEWNMDKREQHIVGIRNRKCQIMMTVSCFGYFLCDLKKRLPGRVPCCCGGL